MYVFLFAEQKARNSAAVKVHTPAVPNQHPIPRLHLAEVDVRAFLKAPRSQSSRIHRGIGRNDDVSAFRSPRLVLVLRRIIRVNHKTKIFRKNAQKHPSQIGKLSSTANPSVCPPYLSNSRRWHALVNTTHLATPFRPRLLRQPVSLLRRGQVTVDPTRSGTDVKFGASSRPGGFDVFCVHGLRLHSGEILSLFKYGFECTGCQKRSYMVPEGPVRNHVGADLDHHARHAFEMVSSILGCRKREVVECEKNRAMCFAKH